MIAAPVEFAAADASRAGVSRRLGRLRLPGRREAGQRRASRTTTRACASSVHRSSRRRTENRQLRRLLQLQGLDPGRRGERAGHRQGLHRVLPRDARRPRPGRARRAAAHARRLARRRRRRGAPRRGRHGRRAARGRRGVRRRRRGRAHRAPAASSAAPATRRATRARSRWSTRATTSRSATCSSRAARGEWFPRGIPVARVTKVIKRELGRDQDVDAAPRWTSRASTPCSCSSPTPGDEPLNPSTAGDQAPGGLAAGREMRNVAFLALGLGLLRAPGERVSRSRRGADLASGRGLGRGGPPRFGAHAAASARRARPARRDRGVPARLRAPDHGIARLHHPRVAGAHAHRAAHPGAGTPASSYSWACTSTRSREGRRWRSSSATPPMSRDRARGALHLHIRRDVRPRPRRRRPARRADDWMQVAPRGRVHHRPEHDGPRPPRHLRPRRVGPAIALPARPSRTPSPRRAVAPLVFRLAQAVHVGHGEARTQRPKRQERCRERTCSSRGRTSASSASATSGWRWSPSSPSWRSRRGCSSSRSLDGADYANIAHENIIRRVVAADDAGRHPRRQRQGARLEPAVVRRRGRARARDAERAAACATATACRWPTIRTRGRASPTSCASTPRSGAPSRHACTRPAPATKTRSPCWQTPILVREDVSRDIVAELKQHHDELAGVDVVARARPLLPVQEPRRAHARVRRRDRLRDARQVPPHGIRETAERRAAARQPARLRGGRHGRRDRESSTRGSRTCAASAAGRSASSTRAGATAPAPRPSASSIRPPGMDPIPGRDLRLSIDVELEQAIERAMRPHAAGAVGRRRRAHGPAARALLEARLRPERPLGRRRDARACARRSTGCTPIRCARCSTRP